MTPTVSVVIATVGRPDLRRALVSATGQTLAPLEVIIVNDRPGTDVTGYLEGLVLPDIPVRHLNSGGAGGNAARNAGIDAARGDYVALLDDDDVWFANKLETQLARLTELREQGREQVIAVCRNVDERTGRVAPADTYSGGPVDHWLFDFALREPRSRRTLQTSGMVMPTALARAVRFDEQLKVHQDWDFLLRATREHGVHIDHQPEPLYWFSASAPGKVSKVGRLAEEQAWAAAHLTPGSKQLSFYYLTITAPRALQRDDRATAVAAARRGLRGHVSLRSLAFLLGSWAAGLSPRGAVRRLTHRFRGQAPTDRSS
jgi:glycosyltransferase involved in cell wall biosynthesis